MTLATLRNISTRQVLLLACLSLAPFGLAEAEMTSVKLGRSVSLGSLPALIMEEYKLVEKHAKAAGLDDLKVEWVAFAGAAAENDALLSGSVQVTLNGVPGLSILWDKTRGRDDVHGVAASNAGTQLLNMTNPSVVTIRDLTDKDKIAVPAVKVSIVSIVLQMAAAKEFGEANLNKLDPLTVTMSNPDGMVALLTGSITGHFAPPDMSIKELKQPGVHTVLSSDDVLGGPGTINIFLATNTFRKANPRIYGAFLAGLKEADEIIKRDKRKTAEFYVSKVKGVTVDEIYTVLDKNLMTFDVTPENTMKYVDFLYKIGTIKSRPATWKELFFPEIHDLPGS